MSKFSVKFLLKPNGELSPCLIRFCRNRCTLIIKVHTPIFTSLEKPIQYKIGKLVLFHCADNTGSSPIFSPVLSLQSSVLNPQSSILNPQSSILIPQSSVLRPSSFVHRHPFSVLSPQSSALSTLPSVISPQSAPYSWLQGLCWRPCSGNYGTP